jgi:hypothetical protein
MEEHVDCFAGEFVAKTPHVLKAPSHNPNAIQPVPGPSRLRFSSHQHGD